MNRSSDGISDPPLEGSRIDFNHERSCIVVPKLQWKTGFTLIELIVVITLLSIMIGFAIPRFQNSLLSDNARNACQWIILKVSSLKELSLREQRQYLLHMDLNENRLWITDEAMSEEEAEAAGSTGYTLPADMYIEDVEFPDLHRVTTGQVQVRFYKKGYSDHVLIHLSNSDKKQWSLLIEPFLPRVKLYENYVTFQA